MECYLEYHLEYYLQQHQILLEYHLKYHDSQNKVVFTLTLRNFLRSNSQEVMKISRIVVQSRHQIDYEKEDSIETEIWN